jgi:hypothetical protein
VDLSVRVLTTGFWPGQNAPPHINLARIPQQVRNIQHTEFSVHIIFFFIPLFILGSSLGYPQHFGADPVPRIRTGTYL